MKVEQVEKITYQGVAPWMLWVAVVVAIAVCVAIAAVWKVIQISREEKKHRQDEIRAIADGAIEERADTLADDISQKIMDAMRDKFDGIDRKLDADKIRIEAAEKRSSEHDKALERIEQTLDSVDTNIKDLREGFTHLARGTIATLNHQQHNGNPEELEEAARELNRYLTQRPIVPMQN